MVQNSRQKPVLSTEHRDWPRSRECLDKLHWIPSTVLDSRPHNSISSCARMIGCEMTHGFHIRMRFINTRCAAAEMPIWPAAGFPVPLTNRICARLSSGRSEGRAFHADKRRHRPAIFRHLSADATGRSDPMEFRQDSFRFRLSCAQLHDIGSLRCRLDVWPR